MAKKNSTVKRQESAPSSGQTGRQQPARYWELIRAAGKLFEEKGYQGASVRDIADAVGMTSGSFFIISPPRKMYCLQ